VILVFVMHI